MTEWIATSCRGRVYRMPFFPVFPLLRARRKVGPYQPIVTERVSVWPLAFQCGPKLSNYFDDPVPIETAPGIYE